MSQHPYIFPSYQGPQPQQPYPYPPTSAQYGAQRSILPTVNSSVAVTTNQSFEYNGSRIPGLGLGGLGQPTPNAPYRFDNGSWFQGESEVPASNTSPRADRQLLRGQQQSHQQRTYEPYGDVGQPSDNRQPESAAEEGELSDDDSEDLYEPAGIKANPDAAKDAPRLPRPVGHSLGSVGDADGSSIYDSGSTREEGVIDSTSDSVQVVEEKEYSPSDDYEPAYQARERSGSYSPQLSPGEIQQASSTMKSDQLQTNPSFQESLQPSGASARTDRQQAVGAALPNEPASTRQDVSEGSKNISGSHHSNSSSNTRLMSVSEAKKKAQEAILGLWSLKVRYQTYLDEGFDADLMKTLFTDLGLDMSSPQPTAIPVSKTAATFDSSEPQALARATDSKPTTSPETPSARLKSLQPQSNMEKPAIQEATNVVASVSKTAGEERKDRIARMLAEKKQKSKTSVPIPVATTPSILASPGTSTPIAGVTNQPIASASASAKERIRAENNSKIKQKLAALKKSQEEAEAKRLLGQAQTPITTPSEAATASSANTTDPTPPRRSQHESPSEEQEVPSAGKAVLGLSHSSASTPQSSTRSRHLKRPVASDFDNYPSNGSQLKRTRIQDTLIIDVSDDDEDVEMEMESPVDGSTSANQQIPVSLRRQNSLGSFPPLSNSHTWRHKSSPAPPTVQTPPEHTNKLDFLHRQIEEAKKKIAEAEAKKASKRPTGSSTPLVHTPSATDSGMILRSAEPEHTEHTPSSVKSERRDRIASYHLPLVEAALREKHAKLKRLHEEAAQIELELQASLAERRKLTTEIEDLGQSTEAETDSHESDSRSLANRSEVSKVPEQIVYEEQFTKSDDSLHSPHRVVAASAPQDSPLPNQKPGDNMEIDSLESSIESGKTLEEIAAVTSAVASNKIVSADASTSEKAILKVDVSLTQEAAEISHEQSLEGISPEAAEDQAAVDADVSMQTSSVESPPSNADPSELLPAQISNIDKAQVSEREEGEVFANHDRYRAFLMVEQIADEDPYEPSPAQIPAGATEPTPEAPIGEVHTRSSREPRLLTNVQAEPQPIVSSHDLISYHSPLRYFHAYRFHPKYFEDVPGGLKSMTYNSRIDVQRPVCPYSSNGSQCPNGPDCEFQHFENMMVPESDIIAQLGSTDMYTGEQKVRFIEGLKKLLNDLKANKIKDFDRITKAILKYRAEFAGDATKVLPLDGVTV